MNLSELGEWKRDASEKASAQLRSLALAGLAVVWLFAGPFFKGTVPDKPDKALFVAGALLIVALAFDVLQMVARTLILDVVYDRVEKTPEAQAALAAGEDIEVTGVGEWLNLITGALFYLKVVTLAVGYGFIVAFFVISLTR